MERKLVSVPLVFLLSWIQHQAYAQQPVARLKSHPFQERYLDEAPVSGRVIAGVTLTGNATSGLLSMMPPRSAAGRSVCVQVMTRDGRYWSRNTFELPDPVSTAPVALEYPSAHQAFLTQLKSGELAVLGSAGECDKSATDTVFLTSAGNNTGDEPVVSIFVNSGRSDTYLSIKNDAAKRRPTRCQTIEEGRRTGFDTICRIKLDELAATPESLHIRIIRRRYERMLPPTEFTLYLPEPD